MRLERTEVDGLLWRKKVDGSLLQGNVTPIPGWVARMWSISECFPGLGGRRDPASAVTLSFQRRTFKGAVTAYLRRGGELACRLFFDDALGDALAETFVMSNMRHLEGQLRAAEGKDDDVEEDLPFWEFLDIEFNAKTRHFSLVAHFCQKPSFPCLFRRLSAAPPMKQIRDELQGSVDARIYKQTWKPRNELETEIGATNVIYMLIDTSAGLFYVGEAARLIPRLKALRPMIPNWDYYRYDMLPDALVPFRLQIERMLIKDVDGLLGEAAKTLPISVSHIRLVNLKKDR